MSSLKTLAAEFQNLGYSPEVVNFGEIDAVVFDYVVSCGTYKGQTFKIGVGLQEDGYPEYPPHFIYVTGLDSPNLPVHSSFPYNGVNWSSFSVPPSDFWDALPSHDKNMKTYLNKHLIRFWSQI